MVTNPYAIKKSSYSSSSHIQNNNPSSLLNNNINNNHHHHPDLLINTNTITTSNRTVSSTTTTTTNNGTSRISGPTTNTTITIIQQQQHQQQPPVLSLDNGLLPPIPPPPPPPPQYSTFSQAFHDDDDDDNNIPKITTSTTTANIDITDVNTVNAATSTTTTNNNDDDNDTKQNATSSTLLSTTTAFTTDRDYHVLQQQPHVLYVSTKQHGNPILQYIKNVPFTYTRMVPDYIFSNTVCAIYLSGKYHILYRHYIHTRIAALKTDFICRILLFYIDNMDDTDKVLHEINLLCVTHNFILVVGWSEIEMARYIETFKLLQNRDASSIQKGKDSVHSSFVDQIMDVLLSTKKYTKINSTDTITLITQFSTLQNIINATPDALSMIDGLGPTKVQRIYDTFHKPFSTKLVQQRRNKAKTLQQQQQQVTTTTTFNSREKEDDSTSNNTKEA